MHHWVNICSNYQFHNYSIRLCGIQMIAYDRKCMYISFFRKNAGNEFSIKWFSRYKYVKRHVLYGAHRFSHRCKIEQSSKSCGYFDMIFTVATALADILLIFIPFHFIAEANTGKWQKNQKPTHEHRTQHVFANIYQCECECVFRLQWFGPNAFKTSNNKPYRLQDTYTHKQTQRRAHNAQPKDNGTVTFKLWSDSLIKTHSITIAAPKIETDMFKLMTYAHSHTSNPSGEGKQRGR